MAPGLSRWEHNAGMQSRDPCWLLALRQSQQWEQRKSAEHCVTDSEWNVHTHRQNLYPAATPITSLEAVGELT